MCSKIYTYILLLPCIQATEDLHYYNTPASSNQFSKFEITTSIPSDGKDGTGPKQAALKLEFKKYNRRYITFNFKGKGNAQLQFFNSDSSKSFKVIIGGGKDFNKVYVFSSKGKLYSATVNGITSEKEYRSLWIRSKWQNSDNSYFVYVGLCSDPRQNKILDTGRIKKEKFKPKMYHIRLSTTSGISGQWQFASAGEKLGGCGDGIGCSDSKVYKCDQEDKNWDSDKTGLIGTCIPKSGYFSSVIFGSGTCRKVCGTGNEVCGVSETCNDNKCQAATTMSTTTTSTTTTSTTTTTATSTTRTTTATPTIKTTTLTTSTAATPTITSPTTTPVSTTTSQTTTMTTRENAPFSLKYGWAVITSTVGGLATVAAITLGLWNLAACCRSHLCSSRRIAPAEENQRNNGDGDPE